MNKLYGLDIETHDPYLTERLIKEFVMSETLSKTVLNVESIQDYRPRIGKSGENN
jgi:hypothetical protein